MLTQHLQSCNSIFQRCRFNISVLYGIFG